MNSSTRFAAGDPGGYRQEPNLARRPDRRGDDDFAAAAEQQPTRQGLAAMVGHIFQCTMIWNVIDRRTSPDRWERINAAVEPTGHDNNCRDADRAEPCNGEIAYDEHNSISLVDAISWAHELPFPVTLYVYDEGSGTTPSVTCPDP
jgi:hypothetical protein